VARQGYEEFYFFGGPPRISLTRDRLAGYQRGLAEAGLAFDSEWVHHGHYDARSGYEMFAELYSRLGRVPQALFCASGALQEGVLRYLSRHDLLNTDIHLCSFDDHYLYDSLSVMIDTVVQDERVLAWNCFEMIYSLVEERQTDDLQRWLPARLRLRHAQGQCRH